MFKFKTGIVLFLAELNRLSLGDDESLHDHISERKLSNKGKNIVQSAVSTLENILLAYE